MTATGLLTPKAISFSWRMRRAHHRDCWLPPPKYPQTNMCTGSRLYLKFPHRLTTCAGRRMTASCDSPALARGQGVPSCFRQHERSGKSTWMAETYTNCASTGRVLQWNAAAIGLLMDATLYSRRDAGAFPT